MKNFNAVIFPAIIIFFALTLVGSWFRSANLMGTAEAIIPFYNLHRLESTTQFSWTEYPGLGNENSITLAYEPFTALMGTLQSFGIAGFILQAFTYLICLVIAGWGILFLSWELFPQMDKKYGLIAVFFYWFNFISLVNVWNRFLLANIFIWSLLPLTLFFLNKGIRQKRVVYSLYISILSAILAIGLSAPAFFLLFWLLVALFFLFQILLKISHKQLSFNIKFLAMLLTSFTALNLWWLAPYVRYILAGRYNEDIANFFNGDVSVSTFNSLSLSLGKMIDISRFMQHSFFYDSQLSWVKFYNFLPVVLIEFGVTFIILLALIYQRKNSSFLTLTSFFLITIFLMAGSAPPFGDIFNLFFINIPYLHFFRDPFEKFSFILPLVAAPLLAAALYYLRRKFYPQRQRLILILPLLLIVIILGFPFWSGLVFTNNFPPSNNPEIGYKVKVPNYYEQANGWLDKQSGNFRLLGFPLGDEGITYKWEKGYQGVELANVLFNRPIILFRTSVPYYDVIVQSMEILLFSSDQFDKVLGVLNVQYLMERYDVDTSERNMRDPKVIAKKLTELSTKGKITKISDFDKLVFWKNNNFNDKTFYAVSNLIQTDNRVSIADVTLNEFSDKDALYYQLGDDLSLKAKVNYQLIHLATPKEATNEAVFNFNLKIDGLYSILLTKEGAAQPAAGLLVKVDDLPLKDAQTREDGRLDFGRRKLNQGNHVLKIATASLKNLVDFPSEINLNTLSSESSSAINEFDPFDKYLITFDYTSSAPVKFYINQDNDQIRAGNFQAVYTQQLSSAKSSIHFESYFIPRNTASQSSWHFQLEPTQNAVAKIQNFTILKIPTFRPLLLQTIKDSTSNEVLPNINYTKFNPTSYNLHITQAKTPFVLVFSELYSAGWVLSYKDGNQIGHHFLANSYGNGWLIDKAGSYDLTLEFAPEGLLTKSKLISLVSFILAFAYLGIRILNKRH